MIVLSNQLIVFGCRCDAESVNKLRCLFCDGVVSQVDILGPAQFESCGYNPLGVSQGLMETLVSKPRANGDYCEHVLGCHRVK